MGKKYSGILLDNRGDICWVTIHRPGDRNSIDTALMKELGDLLREIENTHARAIIFTGAGDEYFIGGADGIEMMQCRPKGARAFSARIQKLFNRLEDSPLILVAAINGLCFGGGFEFALACDLRVASEEARIGLPEVKVGIIPGGGGTQRLPRLVGMGRAMEMILSGKLYKGKEAFEMGLVHSVAPPGSAAGGSRADPGARLPQPPARPLAGEKGRPLFRADDAEPAGCGRRARPSAGVLQTITFSGSCAVSSGRGP